MASSEDSTSRSTYINLGTKVFEVILHSEVISNTLNTKRQEAKPKLSP